MTTPAFCTLEDIKQYGSLNQKADGTIDAGRDDQLLMGAIPAYSQAVNDRLEWAIQSETFTDKVYRSNLSTASPVVVDTTGALIIKTLKPTIQAVTAFAYKFRWTDTWHPIPLQYVIYEALDSDTRPTQTSYQIQIDPAFMSFTGYRNAAKFVQVSFTGGYTDTPPVLARACAEWIWVDYKLREYVPTMSAGFIGMPMTSIRPSRIPPHIAQLVDAWARKWT